MPRGGQLGQSGFNSLKSGLNYAGRDCDRCDPGPPERESTSPGRHRRPIVPGVCKRHSPAGKLSPGEQDQAPWQEPGEATGATGARAGYFPGALSGPRRPLSPRECPPRPWTPAGHLHPATSCLLPSWGSYSWGRGASNWPTWRQTRIPVHPVPTTGKIPLFFYP